MTIVLLALIVLLLSAGIVMLARIARQQKHALAALRAEEEAIVAEERRMFHYLHDLGEAIWRDDQLLVTPGSEMRILAGDKLLVFGKVADARRWSA